MIFSEGEPLCRSRSDQLNEIRREHMDEGTKGAGYETFSRAEHLDVLRVEEYCERYTEGVRRDSSRFLEV